MKLGRIFALTSVLALSVATVACGDDEGDTGTGDDDVTADDDVEPEPAADDDVEPEPDADDDVEPEPDADDDVEPEPDADDDVEPEPDADDDVPPEPEGPADDDVPPEPEGPADDDVLPQPEPAPADDDAGVEPEPTPEPTPEPEPDCTTPEAAELPEEPDCPAVDDREFIEISGEIGDTEWDCNTNVYLTGLTYVVDGTLTIGPGTQVFGDNESALVITRGSQIDASGTPENPIVFTSSQETREPADWGGVVLLGDAPINVEGGENPIEGIDPTEDNGVYGGSDPDGSCGTLRYARIEFAGFLFGEDNELNALTVGGCGSGTVIDYIQTHRGADDGVEMFGGTADLRHILVTGAADDSLDWDQGWQGRVQNLAIVQLDGASDSGFESDNLDGANDAMPRSMPTMYNFTIAGGGTGAGMVLRRGTWGQLYNGIVMGMPGAGVDFRDEATVAGAEDGSLTVSNSIFWDNGEDYSLDAEDNDGNFDEAAYLSHADRANQQGNPALGAAAFDLSGPDLLPPGSSIAAEGGATPPDDGFFNTCATYIGAFEPGGDDWTAGWTDFPEN